MYTGIYRERHIYIYRYSKIGFTGTCVPNEIPNGAFARLAHRVESAIRTFSTDLGLLFEIYVYLHVKIWFTGICGPNEIPNGASARLALWGESAIRMLGKDQGLLLGRRIVS